MSKLSIVAILGAIVPRASAQGPSSGSGPSSATCSNPTCASPPCAISLLGDCGCTTVSGTALYTHELISLGGTVASNAHIYGPFEAGFSSMQDSIIENWGCSDPSLIYDSAGGTDISIAERHIAHVCGITFPRIEGTTYYGAVGYCGGHTSDYHFHRTFKCLYTEEGAHSTKVGEVAGWNMYGKWEDFTNSYLPYLDACGGHFGMTPESPTASVYHYHAQDIAPGTVGCHGPSSTGTLVSIAVCRALYPDECTTTAGSGRVTMTTADGDVEYDRFCPCYDATGSNVGTAELPALTATDNYYVSSSSPSPSPSASPSPSPSPSPSAATTLSPTTISPGTASWAPEAATRAWLPVSAVSLVTFSAVGLA